MSYIMSKVLTRIVPLCFLLFIVATKIKTDAATKTITNTLSTTKTSLTTLESSPGSLTNVASTSVPDILSSSSTKDNTATTGTESVLTSNTASSEDLGTVIESEDETTVASNDTDIEDGIASNGTKNTTTEETQSWSMNDALKDIAYYLRAYKFNEYDRRYETNPSTASRVFYKEFPRPPLRSLHWEVHKHCDSSFKECVDYLRKRIRYVSLKRTDDTVVVMQEQNWTFANNSWQIKQINDECKKLRMVGDTVANPFEGPLERFQWRVTASYYLCWYTMQQVPELEHLNDYCDNFANCLEDTPNNKDIRALDRNPYACALFSFCPNPCCPIRHLTRSEDCWDSKDNPCFRGNSPGQRKCALNRLNNTEFKDIVLNRWNVTCRCPQGFEWNSRYGICIDVNECVERSHNCVGEHEGCLNLEGSFRCICQWGHVLDPVKEQCIPSEALRSLKLSLKKATEETTEEPESLIRKITKFFRRSRANTLLLDRIIFVVDVLFISLCLF